MVEFGAVAMPYEDDSATQILGPNGLLNPTAASRMLSQFVGIRYLRHSALCSYVDYSQCRLAPNLAIIVSEHYQQSVWSFLQQNSVPADWIPKIATQLADGVQFCHSNRIVIGLLTAEDLLLADSPQISQQPQLKLSRWGLFEIGRNVASDPIVSIWYSAPERLRSPLTASFRSDIWAFGIVMFELFTGCRLSAIWGQRQISSVLSGIILTADGSSILPNLLDRVKNAADLEPKPIPSEFVDIISDCVQVLPSKRPNAAQLAARLAAISPLPSTPPKTAARFYDCNVGIADAAGDPAAAFQMPIQEKAFLWSLCGADAGTLLAEAGVIRLRAPVRSVPLLVIDDFKQYGNESTRHPALDLSVHPLPSANLRRRLDDLNQTPFVHSIEMLNAYPAAAAKYSSLSHQSLIVKERDVDYQSRRMATFRRLLAAFPFAKDRLIFEATKDVPPVQRGAIWAALLDLEEEEVRVEFDECDALTEQPSDRQLQVDIPRCHQYDELMATPIAHHKLKLILKAWLYAEKQYVYWQGLDSLAAPFLHLHFNNVAMAFGCFRKFIKRYLNGFFLQDNSVVIQEYLSTFMQLLAFVDSRLFWHLRSLDFRPELFAIPWFLTAFAHVLPLAKVFHLWDSVLLADSSFPMFVGVALLGHLRSALMSAQFNDAILLFSDLPDVPIDTIVTNAWLHYNSVPVGCVRREHGVGYTRKPHDGPNTPPPYYHWTECPCPTVFAADLNALLRTERLLIVDLRSNFLHNRFSVPGSLNCPFEAMAYCREEFLQLVGTAIERAQQSQHIICLVDSPPFENAKRAGSDCVQDGIDRVCIFADEFSSLLFK